MAAGETAVYVCRVLWSEVGKGVFGESDCFSECERGEKGGFIERTPSRLNRGEEEREVQLVLGFSLIISG